MTDLKLCSVDDCSSKVSVERMCKKHYARLKRTGRTSLKTVLERLNEKMVIDTKTGCWLCLGYLNEWGYGRISVNGKPKLAHRAMWEVINGVIPDGMLVCHKCDVARCVNPDHLFLGTPKDNVRDCMNKGRFRGHENSPWK